MPAGRREGWDKFFLCGVDMKIYSRPEPAHVELYLPYPGFLVCVHLMMLRKNEMQWVCLVQFFKKGKKENSMVAIHIFSCDSLYYILFVHKRNQPIHYRSFHQSRVAKKLLNVVYIHMSVYFSKLRHDRAHLG